MIIDERVDGARVRQFSGEMRKLSEENVAMLESLWRGDQTDGLLAGMATAHQLAKSDMTEHLGLLVAFVANKMEQREIA